MYDSYTDSTDPTSNSGDSLEFYQALHRAFDDTVERYKGQPILVNMLLSQALDSYDGNLAIQTEDEPKLACHRGCATCCTLRVGASAPEIMGVARFLRKVVPPLAERGIDLVGLIREADAKTKGLSEQERVSLRQACPFVAQGVCVIYSVRPLACRSHVSFDVKACREAAAGKRDEVPYSEPHQEVRSVVQNAMQSSLRDAGLPWGLYEFNQGVLLALDNEGSEEAWLAGEDVLAPAALSDVAAEEMAAAFDRLRPDNTTAPN